MLVKDCMTSPVVCITLESNIGEAKNIMKEKGIKRLPVISDDKLVGIIVYHDIERALVSPGYYINVPVEWVMTKDVVTITEDRDISEAAKMLLENNVTALPVVSGDSKVVGIVTADHILREYIRIREQ